MMRITCLIIAVLLCAWSQVQAGVVYVDASLLNTDIVGGGADTLWVDGDDGSTGGTPADGSANNDGLWRFRSGFGNGGIFEATGSGSQAEDAVEIVTTATGLANGTYNAYVFYFPGTGSTDHWLVRAGLASNPNANQIFDDGADPAHVGAIAGFDASTLTFEAGLAPPVGGESRILQAGLVGQANVAGGSLSLFIDDYPATITGRSQDRTWYAGIGYELVPEPAAGLLATIGVLLLSSFRTKV